ncbi:type II and III secretion system protein [Enterobacillus tribolii]|uniref:Toxin co-regulated pilus biosynthesis outer membrane protein C n=1 Tax=Enterobacillus tribolii TaxID=1487935 RepID=A0A370QRK6_9GAMM|nr:type II and III secretion system protein [Enterobacillus tribolii]MBW7983612.1 type II and III secretion system protein [Enterobacillus tribolii]RDK91889.1 toxin co-regulated pilus biosynthesis outer membrane protein C [Enterobacillus tribolii]
MIKKFSVGAVSLAFLLQGCSSSFENKYDANKAMQEDLKGGTRAEDAKVRPYIKYDTAFLGQKVEYSVERQNLLNKPVKIQSYEAADIETILASVAVQTGISYRIDSELKGKSGSGNATGSIKPHSVNFTGSFEEFMRYISSLYDVSVSLDKSAVLKIKVYDNYAIKLDFYGGDNKTETTLDLSGNEATSGGGLTGKSETKFESSFWDDVDDMAGKYVSSGIYNIFKDASILMFTGRPSEYEALNNVLQKYKTDNNKQFVVTYKIFTLDNEKVKSAAAGLNISYNSNSTSAQITTQLMQSIGGGISAGWKSDTWDISGQLEALYNLTGNRVIQSGSFITRNNMPVPLNMTNSKYYVSSRTRSVNAESGNEDVSVVTSELVTGTSFIITPRVLSDGRIEVINGFTKRELVSIDTFDAVQLPAVNTTESFNSAIISPGSLLMVAKYDAKKQKDSRNFMLLGAGTETDEGSATVVMVVGVDYYRAPFVAR